MKVCLAGAAIVEARSQVFQNPLKPSLSLIFLQVCTQSAFTPQQHRCYQMAPCLRLMGPVDFAGELQKMHLWQA